uniref:Uncharacterized protein n=1 Tax=Aegilops tauschii TaxID=37682 RepID=R7W7G1_AEGTA
MRSHGSLPGSRRASTTAVLCTSTVVGNYAPLPDLHWVLAVAFIACVRPQIRSSGCSGSAGEHAPSTLLCVRRHMGHGGAAPALVLSSARPVLGGIGQQGTTGRLVRG